MLQKLLLRYRSNLRNCTYIPRRRLQSCWIIEEITKIIYIQFLRQRLWWNDSDLVHFAEEKEVIQQLKYPCLLLGVPNKLEKIRRNQAPHCRILMVNDEWCKQNSSDVDVRFYHYEGMELWNKSTTTS